MMRALAALAAAALGAPAATPAPDLMPLPASISWGDGKLAIDVTFRIALAGYRDPRLTAAAARLPARLTRHTGIPIPPAQGDAATATLVIECQGPGERVQSPREDESYRLDVTPQQARIAAATPVGALHGIETFLQLVGPGPGGFAVPALRIEDKPRFAWRGLMIDVSRHFLPVEAIERNLDGMAAVKLNVLHWHLSDDQGFRVESRRFPKLQQLASDGLYYTQDQVRRVIAYAREHGIRVVPEFDMPGHSTAWFAAYPELASAPGPYHIERGFGVFDPCMDPSREPTFRFLDAFIGEMAALFPDEYFHTGGDEVNGKDWDRTPRIRRFKRAHGFKTNEALQAYFSRRVHAIVMAHGKKVIGWDEILDPALAKSSVVQVWRNSRVLADAARQGHQVILSNGYYLDLMQPAAFHYGIDPLGGEAAGLSAAEKSRVLGGEACQWSELIDSENADFRIWPRMAAIAERLWSAPDVTDVGSMYRRLESASVRLEYLGLTHRSVQGPMLDRIAGDRPAGALRTLAAALEPVKGYGRHAARDYTSSRPLNRMVDATPAESAAAREFSEAVDALLAGDQTQRERVRQRLTAWRDQYEALKPVFSASSLAAEIEPVSRDVSVVAAAGLQALDSSAPPGWPELLDRARKPQVELLIVILDPVRRLVQAASAPPPNAANTP
ncbi:MAG: family 20 glycosylhydrolase [Bryobacteraceae bacterium]